MSTMDQIAQELAQFYKEHMTRLWAQYTTGFDLGVEESQHKVNAFKKNPENFKRVCETLEKSKDPAESRKAKILHNSFKEFHRSEKSQKLIEEIQSLENSIMDVINKSRAKLNGKELTSSEINKIIAQSPDRALRQSAYECRLPLNQTLVDVGFIKLLDLRKELAAASGYKSFVDYKLDEEELTSDLFSQWPEECKKRKIKFQEKAKRLANKYLQIENLAPWDYNYLKTQMCSFNQSEVDMTKYYEPIAKTFLKFGFDIRELNLTYDIFPRKHKSEWGYNFPIEIGKDSRILANVTNRFSQYNALLHETAHGVHFMGLHPDEHAFNSGISGIVCEGFANYFGSLSHSREFLEEIFPQETVDKAYMSFQEVADLEAFQNFRSIAEILFDQQLYLNDLRNADDIQKLRQSINVELLGEPAYQVPWSWIGHHAGHPIYLHNYFLGDVMCENMKMVFAKHNSGKTAEKSPLEFGQFWKEKVLGPAGRHSFLDLYEKVCEEKLSITDYLDQKVLG